jgi:ABC-type Fe3+-siderophore transport system permease subunit
MGLTHGSIAPPDVMTEIIFLGMVAPVIAMLKKDFLRSMVPQRFLRSAVTESITDI